MYVERFQLFFFDVPGILEGRSLHQAGCQGINNKEDHVVLHLLSLYVFRGIVIRSHASFRRKVFYG